MPNRKRVRKKPEANSLAMSGGKSGRAGTKIGKAEEKHQPALSAVAATALAVVPARAFPIVGLGA
jgi:hypothetical protein